MLEELAEAEELGAAEEDELLEDGAAVVSQRIADERTGDCGRTQVANCLYSDLIIDPSTLTRPWPMQ